MCLYIFSEFLTNNYFLVITNRKVYKCFILLYIIMNKKKISEQSRLKEELHQWKLNSPETLLKKLNQLSYNQEEAKKIAIMALQNSKERFEYPNYEFSRSHILMTGPSGTGKSKIIHDLSKIVDVPLVKINYIDYSPTDFSYFINSCFGEQLAEKVVNGEIKKYKKNASSAIIHFDGIDKLASRNFDEIKDKQSLQDVLVDFLGNDIEFVKGLTTKYMTFFATGVLDIEKIIEQRISNEIKSGFRNNSNYPEKELQLYTSPEDLVKYGFTPKLIGTFTNHARLRGFDENDLYNIINMPNSYLNKKINFLKEKYDVDVKLTKGAKNVLAEYLVENKINVKGLSTAVDSILIPIYFSVKEYKGKIFKYDKFSIQDFLPKREFKVK